MEDIGNGLQYYEDFYILGCLAALYERINIQVLRSGWKDFVQSIKEMLELNYYVYLVMDTSKKNAYDWSCQVYSELEKWYFYVRTCI